MLRIASTMSVFVIASLLASGGVGGNAAQKSANGANPVAANVDLATAGGTLVGLVISTEAAPIEGAQASVDKAPAVYTAAHGRFVVQNLTAGTHTVEIAALGFQSYAKRVDISADQGTAATFQLSPIPIQKPY